MRSSINKRKRNNNSNLKRKKCYPIGNKISVIKTLSNNNYIKFIKEDYRKEAINKLKHYSNSGVYFIYVDKINEGYSFKGIYKRGPSEINHICNKIFGIPNAPLILSYENFYILIEGEKGDFTFSKLNNIDVLSFQKSILLIKNK